MRNSEYVSCGGATQHPNLNTDQPALHLLHPTFTINTRIKIASLASHPNWMIWSRPGDPIIMFCLGNAISATGSATLAALLGSGTLLAIYRFLADYSRLSTPCNNVWCEYCCGLLIATMCAISIGADYSLQQHALLTLIIITYCNNMCHQY